MKIRKLYRIGTAYRQFQRYREIAKILLRHGFDDLIFTFGLRRYLPLGRRRQRPMPEITPTTRYQRLRMVVEELGPTFIKFGQLLSSRRDLLPREFIAELETLQDKVTPFSAEEARAIVEEELGGSLDDIFKSFNPQPSASASIAQVHEAVTHGGERVAVKIRRPHIQKTVETDISIMYSLANFAQKMVEGSEVFEIERVVTQFARMIRKELDFSLEFSNIQRFNRCFEHKDFVHVPKVYSELSSHRVLTMEYISGIKITDLDSYEKADLDREAVATRGAEFMLEQIFTHGFFHADPHPGNIRILPGNVLCMLDYGIMGTFSERNRDELAKLVMGFTEMDEHAVSKAVMELSSSGSFIRTTELEADIANFMEDHLYRPVGEINLGNVMGELGNLLIHYDIHLPPNFFLIIKCIATAEGVGQRLIPEFDLQEYAKPFAHQIMRDQIKPKKTLKDIYYTAMDTRALLRDLPSEIKNAFNMFREGNMRIKFQHTGLEELRHTHDQVSNRIVFGIVLAALIIGSSVMVHSDIPPKWNEIPLIGLGGFIISGLMGFSLLYSIIRHGKM
ncbi:MAG: ABC1 kinase family protein [Verrucomicrobiota bacterium]